jgi:transcriptional regulator with XRE-family HTH domain
MHIIKQFCKENNTTIKDLADKVNRKPRYIYQVIANYRNPSLQFARALETATGGKINRMDVLYPK